MNAETLAQEAQAIAERCNATANPLIDAGRFAEAKKLLTLTQKQLREVKRQASAAEREIRAGFQAQRTKVSGTGAVAGHFVGSKGRRFMAAGRQAARRNLATEQQQALLPYQRLRTELDRVIGELDMWKFNLTELAEQGSGTTADAHVSAAATTLAPPTPIAGQWSPDPTGRHQYRWWDGSEWTSHVSDNGATSVDPI